MTHAHPQVTGNWRPIDKSKHTLERSDTEKQGMIAVRNPEDPGNVLYTTPGQIHNLDQVVAR